MFVSDPSLDVLLRGFVLTTAGLLWVIFLVRLNGLRSFSKMTNFDFVMTVACGSLLASAGQVTEWSGYLQIVTAIATLFVAQYLIASLRRRFDGVQSLLQNKPVLLMRDGEIFGNALAQTRVARDDLIAKLREANALHLGEVRAVVLETTGDISVLHGDRLDTRLLAGVSDSQQLDKNR